MNGSLPVDGEGWGGETSPPFLQARFFQELAGIEHFVSKRQNVGHEQTLQQVRESVASSPLFHLPSIPALLLEAEDKRLYEATETAVQFFGYAREAVVSL